jgi:multiple sugar transport system ATP-binding protein
MRRVPPPAVEAAVRRAADMLGLSTLLDRKPSQLSGGQRQRVALGRALARDARVYLLDEPLSNLDPLLRVDTRTELGVLHRQLGSTMIYVTHDQEEAMTLGTRVAVLREGRLEQVGPPLQVYREPATRFVAGFIGSPAMNLVRMKVGEPASGESRLESPLLQHPLAAGGLRPSAGEIDVGFRPHDMELAGEEKADGVGEVLVIEPLGPQTLVHLRPASLPEMRVRLVVPPETRVNAGDRIGFRIRPDRLHLFDPVTGARLP